MTEQQPPPWGHDPLSVFFQTAEYNDRVTSLKLETPYALLQRLHTVFQRVEATVEKDNRPKLLVPRFFIVRSHSSFLAAIRLAMSGQLSEAYAVLRVAIEQAWYALYIAKDPRPPERVTVWLCRNEDEAAKSKCKTEFTVRNVRSTHESLDPVTAKQLYEFYETMIDFGAHPNQLGLLSAMSTSETEQEITYSVGILFLETVPIAATLRMAAGVAIGTLMVFQLIFLERFQLMSLDMEIEALVGELNSVFKSYASKG
jgi:hypothetical protein